MQMKIENNLILSGLLILIQFVAGCSPGLFTRRIQVQQKGKPSTYNNSAQGAVQFISLSGQQCMNVRVTLDLSVRPEC